MLLPLSSELQHENARIEEEFEKKMNECIAKYAAKFDELNVQHKTSKASDENEHSEKIRQLEVGTGVWFK